jgi:hypothetical protein
VRPAQFRRLKSARAGFRLAGRASLHLPAGIVELRARICCGALLSRAAQPGARRRPGGSRFTFVCFWCTLRVCRIFGSSAHGPAQPSSNYAFKRTAGTLHRVSCCSVGPRPLNAPLDEGAAASQQQAPFGSEAFRCTAFAVLPAVPNCSFAAELARSKSADQERGPVFRKRVVAMLRSGSQRSVAAFVFAHASWAAVGQVASACGFGLVVFRWLGFSGKLRALVSPGAALVAPRSLHLTMRSSGPRGQSIVFPATLSARGRLTRR